MTSSDDEPSMVADPRPLEVSGGRGEAAARVLHRFEEDGGHRLGAFEEDHLLDAVGGPQPELAFGGGRVGTGGGDEAHLLGAVEVGVGHAEAAGHQGLEHLLHARDARDGKRSLRRAVVGDRPGDHLVLGRASLQLPVVLGELERGLDRLAAAGGEEDSVEVAGRVGGQTVGELDRVGVRVRPDREEGEFLGLAGRDIRESLATVAGVDNEQAAEAVDVLAPGRVPDVVALALDDDGHSCAALHDGLAGEVHPEVVFGLLLKVRLVVGGQARFGHCHLYLVPQL